MLFLVIANFYLMNNNLLFTLFLKYVSYINPVVVLFYSGILGYSIFWVQK